MSGARRGLPAGVSHALKVQTPKALLSADPGFLGTLPVDHSAKPAPLPGGHTRGHVHMLEFIDDKLPLYAGQRNEPDHDVASGFAPFLHFGYLSVHEFFSELSRREKWTPEKLSLRSKGSREGWWNMGPAAPELPRRAHHLA